MYIFGGMMILWIFILKIIVRPTPVMPRGSCIHATLYTLVNQESTTDKQGVN